MKQMQGFHCGIMRKIGGRNRMNKRKCIVIMVGLLSVIGFSGCGNEDGPTKEELQEQVSVLNSAMLDYEEQITTLQRTLSGLTGTDSFPSAIVDVEDGSGRKTFQSIGGKIMFNRELEYPGSTQAPNTSAVQLSDKFTIKPSDNWVVQMNGTTTRYSHPNGVYGTIKVIKIDDLIKTPELKEQAMIPFVESIPYTTEPEYDEIYFDDISRGVQVTLDILNNSKPALIKSGVCGIGEYGLVYTFYYDGDRDSSKTELINSLLRSISYSSQSMRVDS